MSSYSIGVVYPSRGMCFTETFKEVLDALTDSKALYEIYWSHGNKLPACFNRPLVRALRGNHTHILLLEDDMVVPKGILKEMLEADEDIISCDYPIVELPSGTVLYDKDDNAIFTGTGFMLAKRHVFDKMPRPIFRSDLQWEFKKIGDKVKFKAQDVDPDKVYGHHDITFGLFQYINGKPIKVHHRVLSHRKLKQKGETANNIGVDDIILFDKYRKINYYMIEGVPLENDKDMTTHVQIDGKPVMIKKSFAQRLGLKEYDDRIIYKNVIIDVNNNKKAIKALRKEKK